MATVALTRDNFSEQVEQCDIAVLDFWAPWCAPCRSFAPTFEAVSGQFPDILFGKIDTQEQQELGAHFNIRSIPTLMIIREGVVLFSQAGALAREDLVDVVNQAMAIDMNEVHAEVARMKAEQE